MVRVPRGYRYRELDERDLDRLLDEFRGRGSRRSRLPVKDVCRDRERSLGKRVRVSEPVIKLTIARWRRDGLPYCPCRPGTRKPEHICPCIDVLKILRGEAKRCRCGLYRVVE